MSCLLQLLVPFYFTIELEKRMWGGLEDTRTLLRILLPTSNVQNSSFPLHIWKMQNLYSSPLSIYISKIRSGEKVKAFISLWRVSTSHPWKPWSGSTTLSDILSDHHRSDSSSFQFGVLVPLSLSISLLPFLSANQRVIRGSPKICWILGLWEPFGHCVLHSPLLESAKFFPAHTLVFPHKYTRSQEDFPSPGVVTRSSGHLCAS